MRYVLALLAAVNAWGVMPASSEECEPGPSLASLDNTYTAGSTYTVGSAQLRPERQRGSAMFAAKPHEAEQELSKSIPEPRNVTRECRRPVATGLC